MGRGKGRVGGGGKEERGGGRGEEEGERERENQPEASCGTSQSLAHLSIGVAQLDGDVPNQFILKTYSL